MPYSAIAKSLMAPHGRQTAKSSKKTKPRRRAGKAIANALKTQISH